LEALPIDRVPALVKGPASVTTRKAKQVETAALKSARAKMLKLADKTSNLRAITPSPPTDWSVKRRIEYVKWAQKVVEGLRGVNPRLEAVRRRCVCGRTVHQTR